MILKNERLSEQGMMKARCGERERLSHRAAKALRAIRSSTSRATERETEIEPHRMADDFWRETKTVVIGRNAVCFHKAI
jgi:hypothetical protein